MFFLERRYSGIAIGKGDNYMVVSSYTEDDSLVSNNLVVYFTLIFLKGSKMKKLHTYSIKIPAHNGNNLP